MTRVRVESFTISLDGYGAGPGQSLENPLGVGGTDTIRQYLREGLVDEFHFAIAPVLLGRGERLFDGVDLRTLGYACVETAATAKATHVVLRRQGPLHDGSVFP